MQEPQPGLAAWQRPDLEESSHFLGTTVAGPPLFSIVRRSTQDANTGEVLESHRLLTKRNFIAPLDKPRTLRTVLHYDPALCPEFHEARIREKRQRQLQRSWTAITAYMGGDEVVFDASDLLEDEEFDEPLPANAEQAVKEITS